MVLIRGSWDCRPLGTAEILAVLRVPACLRHARRLIGRPATEVARYCQASLRDAEFYTCER